MKIAIATSKRLSLAKKRQLKHKLRDRRIQLPKFFDRKMHTLVYDLDQSIIYESQMKELSTPDACVFVTYDQLIAYILHRVVPRQVTTHLRRMFDEAKPSIIEHDEIRAVVTSTHEDALRKHSEEKPMTRNRLKKMKRDELLQLVKERNINIVHVGRITKQVIIDQIIERLIENEKDFTDIK